MTFFLSGLVETIFTRFAVLGLGLVTSVMVSRVLGPEGRGLYSLALALSATGVQLGNLGLYASNTYLVARDRRALPNLVSNSLIISFLIGGAGAFVAWQCFRRWPNVAPMPGYLLFLALTAIPFGVAYLLLRSLLIGIQATRTYNKIDLAMKTLGSVLLGLVILSNRASPEAAYTAQLIAQVIGFVCVLLALRSEGPIASPSWRLLVDNIGYSSKAYWAALFSFLTLKADLFIVRFLLGIDQAGYYSAAVSLIDLLYTLPAITGMLLFPRLSASKNIVEKWAMARRAIIAVACFMLVTASFAALAASTIVQALYGPAFLPTATVFIALLPALVILSINTMFMNYFASVGMPTVTVYSPAVASFINIILNLWLVPKWGLIGASAASTVAYTMMLSFSIRFIRLQLKGVPNG